MHRRTFLLSAAAIALASSAQAADPLGDVPGAKKVGAGRLTFWLMPIFDATLYAPDGHLSLDRPFALTLAYLRPLKGTDIARSSVEEMRRQGFADEAVLANWEAQMTRLFPDVDKGVSLTGVRRADGSTVFYRLDQGIGTVEDPEFAKHFFNIWLGAKTSQPALRRLLLGGG